MSRPRVSIIIPTFDRPHMLPRCVESARGAGSGVEVIVVDDASTDETAEVCRGLGGVRHVRLEHNQGVAGARNVGLLASTCEYVAFLDDDDLRLPGSLDLQLALLEAEPEAAFVGGGVLLADQDLVPTGETAAPGAPSGDIFWQVVGLGVHLIPSSVVVRKSCVLEVGLFDPHIPGIDDWDMWARLAESRPAVLDARPVCVYRSPTPDSGQGSSALGRHMLAAVRHQRKLLLLPRARAATAARRRAARHETRRRVADTLSWRAAEQLPHGAFRFAASNFLAALRIQPLWAARPTHFRVLWRGLNSRTSRRPDPPARAG
ncbi:MAG: glycosyltransferase family 2 protein [Pyrinomonadaceae bacterium]